LSLSKIWTSCCYRIGWLDYLLKICHALTNNCVIHHLNLYSGVFEKVGIEPQIERIGRYKSAGDQLARKSISPENREMLTTLLDNIYGNWLDTISTAKGVFPVTYAVDHEICLPWSNMSENALQFLY